MENPESKLATQIIAEDGEILTTFHIENRSYVRYDELSPFLVQAAVATEDARFYNHSGIDFTSLGRVLFKTLLGGDRSQGGGSTLSQQVAKNLFDTRKNLEEGGGGSAHGLGLIWAKMSEWVTAVKLERDYTKEEIVNMYLNTVFFGSGAYGIKSASQTFFAKDPIDLTVEESAMLIGMVNKPTRYNPVSNPERSLQRRNFVLGQMQKAGYITKAEGTRSFSRDCHRFASLKIDDFSTQSGFYTATDGEPERIVNYANKEIKVRLDGKRGALLRGVTSPTAIEDYYACPYRSFLIHTLKVKEREKGKVNALSVGNLMHEIFNGFIGRVEYATDKAKSDALFNEIAAEVLKKDEYARFDDAESSFGVRLALNECKKYCYEMSRFYSVTAFRTDKTRLERTFGYYDKDGNAYPAVDLMGGKVKLAGKIDRVDEYQNYFRITDYKTGGSEVGDDKIFAGVKLQLYLYSLAVTDKTLAGAYYLRVNDEYKAADGKVKPLFEGKTALDTDALTDTEGEFIPTDGKNKAVTVDTLAGVQKYVKALAEQAAEQLDEGVIVPSPYAGTCAYCDFGAACRRRLAERKVSGVDTEFIENSAKTAGNSKEERGDE